MVKDTVLSFRKTRTAVNFNTCSKLKCKHLLENAINCPFNDMAMAQIVVLKSGVKINS